MRFAHITDAQLGYSQYGLKQRTKDFEDAFSFAMDEALRQKVDLVALGGDIFEMPKPAGYLVELVQDKVAMLRRNGVEVVGVEGNHDASGGKWLSVCGVHNLEHAPFSCQGITFGGISYRRDGHFLEELETYIGNHQYDCISVLVLHQSLLENCPFTTLKAADIISLFSGRGLRHMAMGHIHSSYALTLPDASGLRSVSIVCPGSLEMTDINERRDKYFAITTIDDKIPSLPTQTSLVGVPCRPIMHVVINTEDELTKVCQDLKGDSGTSLLVASVSRDLVHGRERLRAAAYEAGVPERISSFDPALDKVAAKGDVPSWERGNASIDLCKYVDDKFRDKPEQASLVRAILDCPERCVDTVSAYIGTKLKELGYA